MTKQILSWEKCEELAVVLSQSILKSGNVFEYLLLPTRGGLIPGYFVARELGIRKIKTICLESYDGQGQSALKYLEINGFSEEISDPEKWLIIDDILDTGVTIDFLNKKYPGISSACLMTKANGKCDFWAEKVDPDIWIQFPWEKD